MTESHHLDIRLLKDQIEDAQKTMRELCRKSDRDIEYHRSMLTGIELCVDMLNRWLADRGNKNVF